MSRIRLTVPTVDRGRLTGQLVAAAVVVLVAALACVTVNGLQHTASSALWGFYSVDPGDTLASPDGHWQARLLDEGFLLDDEWNKVQVRLTGTSDWREVGGTYDWDASMHWSGSTQLLVADEGSRYAVDVAPAYRRAAPSLVARIASPLISPFLRGTGQIVGLAILIVGLLCVFTIPPWTDRIAAKKLVNEVLTCLREGGHVGRHVTPLQRRSGVSCPGHPARTVTPHLGVGAAIPQPSCSRPHPFAGASASKQTHSVWRRCPVPHGGQAGPRSPRPRRGTHRGGLADAFQSGVLERRTSPDR